MPPSRILVTVSMVFTAAALGALAVGQDLVPEDTCVLSVQAPPGARVTLNGKDYGQRREFRYTRLKQDQLYSVNLAARYPTGEELERKIWIRGGWKINLPVIAPSEQNHEIVPQTGVTRTRSAAVSPGGRYVAISEEDGGRAVVYDARSQRQVRSLTIPNADYGGRALFHPTEKLLLVGCGTEVLGALANFETGQIRYVFENPAKVPSVAVAAAFSPSGRLVAIRDAPTLGGALLSESLSYNISVCVWDIQSGSRVRTFTDKGGIRFKDEFYAITPSTLVFSPDERTLISTGGNDGLVAWDLATGRRLYSMSDLTSKKKSIKFGRPAFTSDGKLICASYHYETAVEGGQKQPQGVGHDASRIQWAHAVGVWNAKDGKSIKTISTSMPFLASNLYFTGRWTVRAYARDISQQGVFYMVDFDLDAGNEVSAERAAFLDSTIGAPELDATKRWAIHKYGMADLITRKALPRFGKAQCERYLDTAITSPVNNRVVLANGSEPSRIFDLDSGRQLLTASDIDGVEGVGDDALASDGETLFCRSTVNGTTRQYALNLLSGVKKDLPLSFPLGGVVGSTRSGHFLLVHFTEANRSLVGVWDARSNRWESKLAVPPDLYLPPPWGRDISPTGEHFVLNYQKGAAVYSSDDAQEVFRIPNHEYTSRLHGDHSANPRCGTFSDDGQLIAVGYSLDADVFEVATGKNIRSIEYDSTAAAIAISHNKQFLAVSHEDGSTSIWRIANGSQLCRLSGHTVWARDVAFLRDSRHVVTVGFDGTARIWDVATGEEVLTLYLLANGEDWVAVTPEGHFDGTEAGMQKVMFRIGKGLNVVPVDRFFQDLYYPGLLAAIYRGERPVPQLEIGKDLPPKVKIVSPEGDGEVGDPTVQISVRVENQGGGIATVVLRQNGARVADVQPDATAKTFTHTFSANLVEGDNRFRVESACGDGSFESEPAQVILTYNKDLPKPDLYVLVVGVNAYAEDSLKLAYAAPDAQAMARLFEERGKALYENVHVRKLLDGDATKRGIRDALREIAEKAREQDTLVVFLSGHGFTVGQRYYFIPQEFRQESARFEDDVVDAGFPGDQIANSMGEVKALKQILVLDTCNSGAGISRSHLKRRNPFAFAGAIRRLSRSQGIYTIAAAAASEDTVEIRELGHGALTYTLLAGLRGIDSPGHADGNADGVVNVLEWFSYAADEVPKLTKQYLGTPQDVKTAGEGAAFPVLPLPRNN